MTERVSIRCTGRVPKYSLLCAVNELVLIGTLVAGLHALVLPERLHVVIELLQSGDGEVSSGTSGEGASGEGQVGVSEWQSQQ